MGWWGALGVGRVQKGPDSKTLPRWCCFGVRPTRLCKLKTCADDTLARPKSDCDPLPIEAARR